jgi:hypothetical protein
MDLNAADPQGGSRVPADVVVADPTRSTAVMVTAVKRGHAARLVAFGKYGNHFPDDTFVPLVVETYGCLDSAFDGFIGTGLSARRTAELRAAGFRMPVSMASRLTCYYQSRVLISLHRSQARAIHHRAARAVQSLTGARPLLVQDGFVRSADVHTVTRVGDS